MKQVPSTKNSPIILWLSGREVELAFGEHVIQFAIRKEMTDSTGFMQNGLYSLLAVQAYNLLTHTEDNFFPSISCEIFKRPKLGSLLNVSVKCSATGECDIKFFDTEGNYMALVGLSMGDL